MIQAVGKIKRTSAQGQRRLPAAVPAIGPGDCLQGWGRCVLDCEKGHIFWVDSERIQRDLSGRVRVVAGGISGVDWLADNVYWHSVGVSAGQLPEIRADTQRGYMYFADNGANPRIIRTRLDGSEMEEFVVSTARTWEGPSSPSPWACPTTATRRRTSGS